MTNSKYQLAPLATRFLAAAAVGLLSIQLALHWVSICGTTAYSLAMGVLGLATALVVASMMPRFSSSKALSIAGLAAIGLSAVSANCLDGALSTSSAWVSASIALGFALPAAFVACCAVCILIWANIISSRTSLAPGMASTLAGALGLAMLSLIFLNTWLRIPAFIFPVVFCVAGTVLSLKIGKSADDVSPANGSERTSSDHSLAIVLMSLACGLLIHATYRLFGTLFPSNLLSVTTSLPLFIFGAVLTSFISSKRLFVPMMSVLALLCPIVFYAGLAEFNLWINASVSNQWLSTILRSMQPAAVCVMLWSLFQVSSHAVRDQGDDAEDNVRPALFAVEAYRHMAFVCCGLALGLMSVAFGTAVRTEWVAGIGLICMVAFSTHSRGRGAARDWALSATVTGSSCLLLLACSLPISDMSHLLFTGRSAIAYRDGLEMDVIQQSDSHRLLDQYTTASGEVTVWRTEGDQIEVRIDGFSVGSLSDNAATSPVPQADALTTILPLVMHERPGEVMLLGDDVGVGVKICQSFPIPSISAFQCVPECAEIAGQHVWQQDFTEINQDPRFTIRHLPPSLAIRQEAPKGGYDVVISAAASPLLADRLPEFHVEHYRRIRGLMSDQGVYCQRVSQFDLGSEALLQLVSTIRKSFPSAIVIQTTPGELVILAACENGKLLDQALLARLQKSHVRRQLALSGLDWSQVAALPVVQTDGLYNLFDHHPQRKSASYHIGSLAFSLPLEASRWADKSEELRTAFGPHQLRIADAAPKSSHHAEYVRRFTAVVQEGEIVTAFPDNPWPYRNSLKMEMQRNPRPPVQNFVGGKLVKTTHPDDQRRKDYFTQLGKLLSQAKMGFTNPVDVQRFQQVISSHEPLLTWFAHHELIRIFEATGRLSPAQEFRSRLYTIHFASVADSGVYQVAAALEQLIEQPELIPEIDRRYDQANGLLQELIRRWERRRGYDPVSATQTQLDVDRCVQVSRRTLDAMEDWAEEMKMDTERFAARRRFIHHALVIPLRKYSDIVLAHRMKSEPPSTATEGWEPQLDTLGQDDELPMLMKSGSAATN